MIVPFDDEDPSIIGKTVLIRVTYVERTEKETGRGQWWGIIVAFNMRDGLVVDLANTGNRHAFPPLPDAFQAAKRGTYQLRSGGETVEDPDLLYTIRRDAGAS